MSGRFCLVGYPLGHSISPEIHARLFALSGVDAAYALDDVPPWEFYARVAQWRELGGFNVTIPYKQRILPLCAGLDEAARRCGAVNTVKCRGGLFYGANTDAEGFVRALRQADIALSGRVLLCGTGGVARMMACEALARGCALTVSSRTEEKALRLAAELRELFPGAQVGAAALSVLERAAPEQMRFDLLLNGTPAGMYPDIASCPVPEKTAAACAAVFDPVYNPAETVLLRAARRAGAKTQGGLPMLVEQAAAAQELWTGARFAPEEIAALCAEMAALLKERFPAP